MRAREMICNLQSIDRRIEPKRDRKERIALLNSIASWFAAWRTGWGGATGRWRIRRARGRRRAAPGYVQYLSGEYKIRICAGVRSEERLKRYTELARDRVEPIAALDCVGGRSAAR